jgi:hypothetical protein
MLSNPSFKLIKMKNSLITILLFVTSLHIHGQEKEFQFPSFSPKGLASQIVGNTQIAVEYERPSVRKRQIFGGLVPWNRVWRTGAGNCTKIRFDRDVKIGGQQILAGSYSVFTIPNPDEWVVIVNSDTTLYGSYDYDHKNDVARFVVIPTKSSRFYETLNIDIELIQHNAKMYLSWANTQISFDIETSTNTDLEKFIDEQLLTGLNKLSDNYAGAAAHLAYRGIALEDAINLAEKAKELDPQSEWIHNIKIGIYEDLHLYDDALEEVNQAIELLKTKEGRAVEIAKMESERIRIKKLRDN